MEKNMSQSRLIKGDGVPFTQISNEVLNHKELSLKAKGLYAYMYSKPNDWKFSADLIATQNKDSRDSILSGLKELAKYGLLSSKKHHTGSVTYTLYINPTNPTEITEEKSAKPSGGGEPSLNRKIPLRQNPTKGKSGPISNKDLLSNKDILSNPVKSAGCRLKISEEVRAFKDKLFKSGHVGLLGRIYVEGSMEEVYIDENRLLYTSSRTPRQIVSSTISEIYTTLYELNELQKRGNKDRVVL